MSTFKINDSIFEALFRQAIIERVEQEVQALPAEAELTDIAFSHRHEKRMEKLFSSNLRKSRIAVVVKLARRAAVLVLIVATLLFGVLMTSQDVRAAVVNTVVQWFEQFALFTSEQEAEPTAFMLPTYVPDGFVEIERIEMEHSKSIVFVNEYDDMIFFFAQPVSGVLAVDHEQRGYELIIVNGFNFHTFSADEFGYENTIIWEYSGNRYSIFTSISTDIAIKIALSIQ